MILYPISVIEIYLVINNFKPKVSKNEHDIYINLFKKYHHQL